MVFLKDFFEKLILKKFSRQQKHEKLPSMLGVNIAVVFLEIFVNHARMRPTREPGCVNERNWYHYHFKMLNCSVLHS